MQQIKLKKTDVNAILLFIECINEYSKWLKIILETNPKDLYYYELAIADEMLVKLPKKVFKEDQTKKCDITFRNYQSRLLYKALTNFKPQNDYHKMIQNKYIIELGKHVF